jgi:transposase-like protein
METYPNTQNELEEWFSSEEACREYLERLRWPNGFVCPHCGIKKAWKLNAGLFNCAGCGKQTSVTAGTLFERTRKPLVLWFRVIWWVTSQKNGASALGLQHSLGIGTYKTAWIWLHKLRRAMVRPDQDRLSGTIQVDETYVGGKKQGKRGRGAEGKVLVLILAEKHGSKAGRIRLRCIEDASAKTLSAAVKENVEKGSHIETDGWSGYNELSKNGFSHERLRPEGVVGDDLLPLCHRQAALLKRWLLGTHQGAVSHSHLDYYLDEYTFRFSRRTSRHRGLLFYRLLQKFR